MSSLSVERVFLDLHILAHILMDAFLGGVMDSMETQLSLISSDMNDTASCTALRPVSNQAHAPTALKTESLKPSCLRSRQRDYGSRALHCRA